MADTYLDDEILCQALLQYRNTPSRRDGKSPAQKLYGHPVQDTLPAHRRSFAAKWQQNVEQADTIAEASQDNAKKYYNRTANDLPEITVGSNVAIQNPRTKLWDSYGVVRDIGPHRQYHIRTKEGRMLTRNRRFIRRRIPASIPLGKSAAAQSGTDVPRRSRHSRRPPNRLIEDPTWT